MTAKSERTRRAISAALCVWRYKALANASLQGSILHAPYEMAEAQCTQKLPFIRLLDSGIWPTAIGPIVDEFAHCGHVEIPVGQVAALDSSDLRDDLLSIVRHQSSRIRSLSAPAQLIPHHRRKPALYGVANERARTPSATECLFGQRKAVFKQPAVAHWIDKVVAEAAFRARNDRGTINPGDGLQPGQPGVLLRNGCARHQYGRQPAAFEEAGANGRNRKQSKAGLIRASIQVENASQHGAKTFPHRTVVQREAEALPDS